MAEVVISPLLQVIFEKLASPILTKFELGKNYKKDLDKIRRALPMIQAVIEDAEVKQWKDKKVRIWLVELKSLAYDVDDLLDEITARLHRNKVQHATCTLSLVPLLSNYYKMPQKLKRIQDRLDEVVSKMSCFRFKEMVSLVRSQTLERRETGYYVDESDVFGRTEDLERVVSFVVCSNSDGVKVRSLSVVGIGGIGKTTLAQLVYNDERVERNFDLRIWISVCQEFDVKQIMNGILDYADHRPKCESKQLGVLQSELHKSLNGKRYILVLDDVWNDDQDEWEKLQYPLRSGAEGSRIIVTTRSSRVASIVSTTAPYFLEALGYDDCRALFNKRAFSEGEQGSYPELLEIGRQIAKKCRGVPLAAKVLGSLMRFKREEKEWLHVLESELWNMDIGDNRIMSALRLSYNHLPSHLKRCFAYCAVLPKSFEMRRDKLVHLWIAEGLIQSSNDNAYSLRKMEDAGNEYFNEFLLMSLFQLVDATDQFQMHDLLHDLAKQVAGNEFLTVGEHDRRPIYHGDDGLLDQALSQVRHAAVLCNSKSSIPKTLYGARQLRSLILFSPGDDSNGVLNTVVRAFKRLRVLDLSDSGMKRLNKSIGSLVHLRYFDLSHTYLETLPKAICRLSNLQTLNLTDCYNLKALPEGMERLINLRHLIIKNCSRLTRMPPSIRALLNLQTLSFYIVGRSFEENLFQLVHLDLCGEIKIRRLENADEFVPDLCFEEKQLHSLGLSWGDDVEEAKLNDSSISPMLEHHGCDNEILLNYLKPNAGLRKLYLSGYYGLNFPHWLNNTSSPNLREVVLKNCRRCERLPSLGQLQFLEALFIQGLEALKSVGGEFYGEESNQTTRFPSLKQLTIQNCPALENWESQLPSTNTFTSLDRLSLIECPRLETMPFFPKVKHLELRNCNTRIIRKAAELTSLSTLIINDFQDLTYLPQGLLQNNPSLQSLTISSCPQLSSLPWDLRNLGALQSLTIRWCNELTSFPKEIKNFTSLEALEITECPSLTSLPEEGIKGLQSLRSLSIEFCLNLTSLPNSIMQLNSLERLTIMYCPSLANLPDGVQQQLPALRSLSIISCKELACLPEELQHVKTLQNLEICGCPKLIELPEWVEHLLSLRSLKIYGCCGIKSLPKGLECLKALQHLSIRDCPDLEEKCVKGKGNNWTLIAHVPYLYIGSSAVELQVKAVAGQDVVS